MESINAQSRWSFGQSTDRKAMQGDHLNKYSSCFLRRHWLVGNGKGHRTRLRWNSVLYVSCQFVKWACRSKVLKSYIQLCSKLSKIFSSGGGGARGIHLWRPHGGSQAQMEWTHVDSEGGSSPCGRPHRTLKLVSTDVILSSSHAKKLASF